MCKFFIIGIRVQFENSVVESVVVSKQEYQRVRFDTTTFYMLIIIRLSHLLPALAFLDFADRQSAYPSPCLCFSLFVQHRASGLLPLFLHCRKCRAWRIRFAEFPISDYWRLVDSRYNDICVRCVSGRLSVINDQIEYRYADFRSRIIEIDFCPVAFLSVHL